MLDKVDTQEGDCSWPCTGSPCSAWTRCFHIFSLSAPPLIDQFHLNYHLSAGSTLALTVIKIGDKLSLFWHCLQICYLYYCMYVMHYYYVLNSLVGNLQVCYYTISQSVAKSLGSGGPGPASWTSQSWRLLEFCPLFSLEGNGQWNYLASTWNMTVIVILNLTLLSDSY